MKLSKRLRAIYDFVNSPCVLADIGCDHALLPIALVLDKKCRKAYACDLNEGPLARAKEAVQQAQLDTKIQTILSNGLDKVPEDVTCIVIAGMGWETIIKILEANLDKVKACPQVILQSNNHVDDLRRWLSVHDFFIEKEDMVKEYHYYQILSIHHESQALREDQLLFGVNTNYHPLFIAYWEHELTKKKTIIAKLSSTSDAYRLHHESALTIENKLSEVKNKTVHK